MMSLTYIDKDETYEVIATLRFEALATEVNRRRQLAGEWFSLIGQPFVSGQYVCQAILTSPDDKVE